VIETTRFILRPLTIADVSPRYLSWLSEDRVLRFINGARGDNQIEELKSYVAQREGRVDVLFLGIFTHAGEHIGNIKYEPIDLIQKYAVMGIMIGQLEWQGKAVAQEVITKTTKWLNEFLDIKSIFLGVDNMNINAIKAYERCGFVFTSTNKIKLDKSKSSVMVKKL
jgi:RimJ/RimL family protein N-acetyltransferase